MDQSSDNLVKKIWVVYIAVTLCMLVMVIWTAAENRRESSGAEPGVCEDISQSFTDQKGEAVDLERLDPEVMEQAVSGEDGGDEGGSVSFFYDIPKSVFDRGLVYRSQDVYTEILIDGEVIYRTKVRENSLYHVVFGSSWNVVKIPADTGGDVLELRLTPVRGKKAQIDHVYWGDTEVCILTIIRSKLPAVVISLFMCFLGLLLILLDLPFNVSRGTRLHSMFHLGVFAVIVGGWCLIETKVLHFIVNDTQVIQMLDNMLMILSAIPLFLYANSTYHILKYKAMRALCILDLVFLIGCVALPLFGVTDWHGALPAARAYLGLCAIVFILWVRQKNMQLRKAGKFSVESKAQLFGIDVLGISLVAELIRYHWFVSMDKASVMRVGLLLFIVCFGISSQMKTIQLLQQGKEYEFVRKLAYLDGLTGMGNRTAYLEQLDSYVEQKEPFLGIVFLDINNLKKVNDNQGHEMGDKLIRAAAEAIQDSFGAYGKVYRIGGDEFCVLIANKNVSWMYEEAEKKFRDCVREANAKNPYDFFIQIAYGFASCQALDRTVVDETVKQADELMYQCKARLKAQNNNP